MIFFKIEKTESIDGDYLYRVYFKFGLFNDWEDFRYALGESHIGAVLNNLKGDFHIFAKFGVILRFGFFGVIV